MIGWLVPILQNLDMGGGSVATAPVAGRATIFVAEAGGRIWTGLRGERYWGAERGGRVWVAGGRDVASRMVLNDITEAAPGSGTFRATMDFGNLAELQVTGVTITSCTVSIQSSNGGSTATATTPATLENAYRVSTVISGGQGGYDYDVTFTATLSTGQVLPPRVGTWKAK